MCRANLHDKPIVSVRLMTYNHEPYIREAMNGIMMQKTDFLVEVVVGDDFSDDNTLDIINEFKDTENIKIKILKRVKGDEYDYKRQKLGRIYNFINILENCKGKYIALLDGDDYWIDPLKLQKQVDFLEKNKDFVLVSNIIKVFYFKDNSLKTIREFHTSGLLFRNVISKDFFNYDYYNHQIFNMDTFLMLYLLHFGKRRILDFEGSVYRVGLQGVFSSKTKIERRKLMEMSYKNMMIYFKKYRMKKSIKELRLYLIDLDISNYMNGKSNNLNLFLIIIRLLYKKDFNRIKSLVFRYLSLIKTK